MRLFNKQWKRIFTFVGMDSYGFAIDTTGLQHDVKALRAVQSGDEVITHI